MPTRITIQQPPSSPADPRAPVVVDISQPIARPLTSRDIAAIRERREELSNQLESAASRREGLAEDLRTADIATRPGLEQRIAVLDQRIVQIEQDIAETGRELTSSAAGMVGTTAPPAGELGVLNSNQITGISIVFTVLVLFPIALAFSRLLWKRVTAPVRPAMPAEASQRLERLEQAVDTVALEMERVSEGTRFMTKLLMEPNALAAIEARQRTPDAISARERESIRVGGGREGL